MWGAGVLVLGVSVLGVLVLGVLVLGVLVLGVLVLGATYLRTMFVVRCVGGRSIRTNGPHRLLLPFTTTNIKISQYQYHRLIDNFNIINNNIKIAKSKYQCRDINVAISANLYDGRCDGFRKQLEKN